MLSSSPRSGTNRVGHRLSLVTTRTTYQENSHDNDADNDKYESSDIVSLLVDPKFLFFLVYCTSLTIRASIQKLTVASMPFPRKLIRLALVDLHYGETAPNDKWLTLGAICKLIYTRFNFDVEIDFTVRELKKAANEVGPLGSKILQENHTIVRSLMMGLRRKYFVKVAKKNIGREPGNSNI
jgi:hypothetical protein